MKLYQFTGEDKSFFITELGHSSLSEKKHIGTRIRNDWLLHFVICGKCIFCNEEADDSSVFFIPQGIPHNFTVMPGYEHYWIGFGGEDAPAFLKIVGLDNSCKVYRLYEYEKIKEELPLLFKKSGNSENAEKLIISFLFSSLALIRASDEKNV